MNTTKKILIFYSISLLCFVTSSIGVFFIDEKASFLYAGISIAIIPIMAILTIVYKAMGSK